MDLRAKVPKGRLIQLKFHGRRIASHLYFFATSSNFFKFSAKLCFT